MDEVLKRVIGPHGEVILASDLPASNTVRWTPSRKAMLVVAIRGGLLSLEDALRRYGLTEEEFAEWQRDLDRGGLNSLKVTRTQWDRPVRRS